MDCPLCGASLSKARPRYLVGLGTNDETRSTAATDDGTASTTQVCADCWNDIEAALS